MSAYYREHVAFPNVLYTPAAIGTAVDHSDAHAAPHPTDVNPPLPARLCSVRGCGAALPHDYNHKMCETCRGRHRIYATTKRAKRKMEKAAMGAQNGHVVWMPPDDSSEDGTGQQQQHPQQQQSQQQQQQQHQQPHLQQQQSRVQQLPPQLSPQQQLQSQQMLPLESQLQQPNASMVSQDRVPGDNDPATPGASTAPQYPFPPTDWDHSAIDPRLFSSHTSELAGALTLPSAMSQDPRNVQPHPHQILQQQPQQVQQQPQRPTVPEAASPAPILQSVADGSLPPRFCSIKGCKALVPGNSFFKMCEPCRDRYRNYGTTKRAKWKREKEVAVAELQQLRTEEEKRRADAGLPPLPECDTLWQEYQADGAATSQDSSTSAAGAEVRHAPRMCTVSHCREILPGDYQYLRCERHRIQNRHHSKLKRVRDKEVKAQAYDGWAAAVSARSGEDAEFSRERSEVFDAALELAMDATSDLDADAEDAMVRMGTPADTPLGEPSTGIPPAARGTRRTNHVCSIKVCFNLLSPSNPWKMCDSCRARDRAIRKYKALRESGIFADPPPEMKDVKERRKRGEGRDPAKKSKKKKKKDAAVSAEPSSAGECSTTTDGGEAGAVPTQPGVAQDVQAAFDLDVPSHLVFINPLLPGPADLHANVATTADPASSRQTAHSELGVAAPTVPQDPAASPANEIVSTGATARKKKTRRKDKVVELINKTATNSPNIAAAPSSSTGPPANNGPTAEAQPGQNGNAGPVASNGANIGLESQPNGAYLAPPYHMPYYIPPPYSMQPYPAGSNSPPYPYGTAAYPYMRPPYGASPMYQPPYPPYGPPYAYPPQPYAQPYAPQAYAPPPPAPPTPNQPLFSVSSTFVSRADYAAQNTHTNTTSYAAAAEQASSYYSTFSARTGEPLHRASHTPSLLRRKRALDAQNAAAEASKRQALAVESGDGTPSVLPVVAPLVSNIPITAAAAPVGGDIVHSADDCVQPDTTENSELPSTDQALTCTYKSCHRILTPNSTSTLCARCKERLKKHQTKAKHRFKLEPRKLVGRPSDSPETEQGMQLDGDGSQNHG